MARRASDANLSASQSAHPDPEPDGARGSPAAIRIRLDELLSERAMTLTELSEQVGITVVNLSILKNGRARAIRFSTLAALCAVLGCQPGDLLAYESDTTG
jgi:putative transcriptional regulator